MIRRSENVKKIFGVIFVFTFIFILTGCESSGNKVTCTFVGNTSEYQKAAIVANLDSDGKVYEITEIVTFSTEEEANKNIIYITREYSDAKVKGNTIEIYHLENYSRTKNMVGLTKDEFISAANYFADSKTTMTCN